jgi:glutamyl-tRNA reductase
MPRLVMVGVSHHLTPLAVRECLAFDAERWYARSPRGLPSVLVSTCNRVEVYAWVTGRSAPAVRALQRSLAESVAALPSPLRGVFQRATEAARRVRGGTRLEQRPSGTRCPHGRLLDYESSCGGTAAV